MSFQTFSQKLERFAKALPKAYDDATIIAAQQIKAGIEVRVFNNSKDINGNPIGNYKSEAYKKRRQKKRLQIGRVDLIFTGDLQGSQEIGKDSGDTVLKFDNEFNTIKGRANEERFKDSTSTIFASSSKEQELAIKVIDEEISDLIKQIFGQ